MFQLPALNSCDGVSDVLLRTIREYDALSWCKEFLALDKNKEAVDHDSKNACFICINGALARASGGVNAKTYYYETVRFFRSFLNNTLPDSTFVNDESLGTSAAWNDNLHYPDFSNEGKAHVVATLQAALDYLEEHTKEART